MAYSITIDTNLNTARISQQVDTAVNQFSRFENRVRSASTAANRSVNSIRLDTAIGEINSFAMNSQNAASILDLLQDSVVGFSGKIPAMAGSIAAIVAVIAAFAKIGADAADVFNDMSDRTGVTIENLVGLQLAAQLADTDLESLATSVNKLSVNIANNRDEFAQLGITATDPLEALMQLADVFSSIEDPQERAALGSKALGKSYAELAPLLLQGGAALRKQIQLGQKLSGITTEDAKRAGEFNDSLDVMMFKLKGIGIEIGTVTLMALEQLSNELKTNTEGAETFNNWLEAIGNQMSKGFGIEPFHGMSAAIDDVNQKIINQKALIDGLQKQQNQGGIDWQIGGVSLIGQNKGNGVTLIKKIGEIADSLVGRDVNLEKNRLDALYKERAQLIKGLLDKKQRSANPAATTIKALNTRALYSQATEKYNLRPLLVQAIANVESNGIQAKTSPKGGVGIMQVVPKYHPELDATRLKSDPAYNVDKGAEYLSRLNKMFDGDLPKIVAAYNAGENRVKNSLAATGGLPNIPENQDYVKKVFAELDKLSNDPSNKFDAQLKSFNDLVKNGLEAARVTQATEIDTRLKTTTTATNAKTTELKTLKEQGQVEIADYYTALTLYEERIVQANIEAVQAKMQAAQTDFSINSGSAKPEELSLINANYQAQKASLQTDLEALQVQLTQIKPANIIIQDKEQKELNDLVTQVRLKIADIRGEAADDPIAIKLKVELDNAETIQKLRAGGKPLLANEYISTLTAGTQAKIYQDDLAKIQNKTQVRETQINVLAQTGSLSQYSAQQQLKKLYQEQAAAIDQIGDKLNALGDNTGLDDLKTKALEAKNAAGQLRLTLPSLQTKLIEGVQSTGINSLANAMVNLTDQTQNAGEAFTSFGLDVVKAIQNIAAQQLAEQIIGSVIRLAGSAYSSSNVSTDPAFVGPVKPTFAAQGGYIDNAQRTPLPRRTFAVGGLITGPGTGTSDSIPAAVPAGSFVVKAASVKALGFPALTKLMGRFESYQRAQNDIPVRVSDGEFLVPPDVVKRDGLEHWQAVNNAQHPPLPRRGFAVGGLITGPGTGTSDSIHTTAPAGSFVVKAASVKALGFPALTKLMGRFESYQRAQNDIPVRVSDGEFLVPPEVVKRDGLEHWQAVNKAAEYLKQHPDHYRNFQPPASLQRAYAGGGTVGKAAEKMTDSVQTTQTTDNIITINVPITIANNSDSKQAQTKIDPNILNAVSKDIKQTVDERVQHHLKTGGLLYKALNG